MLTNPTAVELIERVKVSLLNDVVPELQSDRARVPLMMMQMLLTSVQRRVPVEQRFMADECDRMAARLREAVQSIDGTLDGSAVELHAIGAVLDEQPEYATLPPFAELNERYRAVSERFTAALGPLNALDGAGDEAARAMLTKISLRTARDMQAHFAMDAGLVGRG